VLSFQPADPRSDVDGTSAAKRLFEDSISGNGESITKLSESWEVLGEFADTSVTEREIALTVFVLRHRSALLREETRRLMRILHDGEIE